MDFLELLKHLTSYYGVSIESITKNPLSLKAWSKIFKDIPAEEVEKAFVHTIANYQKLPPPQQIYDDYFLPVLRTQAIAEWQKIMNALGDRGLELKMLGELSDAGSLALKAVDGLNAVRDNPNSYTRNEFIKQWLVYYQQLRDKIIEPPPKFLPPAEKRIDIYNDDGLTPEERRRNLEMMAQLATQLSNNLAF